MTLTNDSNSECDRTRGRATMRLAAMTTLALFAVSCRPASPATPPSSGRAGVPEGQTVLPTGVHLDPAAASVPLGSMPLAMAMSPSGNQIVVLLNGWREQGFQVVDRASGRVTQTVRQAAAFIGIAFSTDGRTLYVSGGNQDVVYRYAWRDGVASLTDSLVLAVKKPRAAGRRYPAGIAPSPDGRFLYVVENIADSLAVLDLASGNVVQRVAAGRYPYGVVVAHDGTVYVSSWGGSSVSVFTAGGPVLHDAGVVTVARHPSALVLNADGSRLFVASGSTDQVAVLDTRTKSVVARLADPPPAGPAEGSTPNALVLSTDGTRLFAAEADNNAVAVFDLSAATSGISSARGSDRLIGRIPSDWYPTALVAAHDTLLVLSGKGLGTAPNPDGPDPLHAKADSSHAYTLGQTNGSLMTLTLANATVAQLTPLTARVARAQGWSAQAAHTGSAPHTYPPFAHVIYVIKENRTYDQVLGDLPSGDGDTALVFFPRAVSPNHHALAERFGVLDRFFTNAEVSADGHNWSTGAYATDYLEKTVPSEYSGRGRSYDYEGTNGDYPRSKADDEDDVSEPARGYLWDLAARANLTLRNYGEYVVRDTAGGHTVYMGDKPFLATHTNPDYPGFDLNEMDQSRMDVWLREFNSYVKGGEMPQLEIVRLPNDHTAGARAGSRTPRAYMADNDLALGRMVEALSRSPFWKNTVVFVVEDDAQNGPDHVDSHRAPAFVISAYNRAGVIHRWTNTTDIIATMSEILHTGSLSQFDYYGRPLRDIWTSRPDLSPYVAIRPAVDLNEKNTRRSVGAAASARLDLSQEDRADENVFNRILWKAIKGASDPYPGIVRVSGLEWRSAR